MSRNSTDISAQQLFWVANDHGRPRIQWQRVALFAGLYLAMNSVALLGFTSVLGAPLNLAIVGVPACGFAAFMVMAIELQRQQILAGREKWRFGLAAGMWLMAIAGVGCALIGNALRETQAQFSRSELFVGEIKELIDGGNVSQESIDGRNLSVHVTRADFSDDDLAKLLFLTSHRGKLPNQLKYLWAAKTELTSSGVCLLAECDNLRCLELPSIALTTEAITAITRCVRLEQLYLNEQQLSAEQWEILEKNLPQVSVNGRSWTQRKTGPAAGPN